MNKLKILLLFSIITYLIVFILTYRVDHVYDINDKEFYIKINNYKIDGNKLTIYSDNLVSNYYFKTKEEKDNYNYSYNDILKVKGNLNIPNNNTIPNTFNYRNYLYYNNLIQFLHRHN